MTEGAVASGSRAWLWRWLAGMAILVIWQLLTGAGFVSPLILPSPLEIAIALSQAAASGELWLHLGPSLQRVAAGWAIGAALAIAAGAAAGRAGVEFPTGNSRIAAVSPVAALALLPLFVIWFDGGDAPIVAATACGVFPPVAAAVCAAARERRDTETGSWSSLRNTSTIAVWVVAISEMIAADEGIGRLVIESGRQLRTEQMLAGVAVLCLLGVAVSQFLALFTRLMRRRA